MPPQLRRLLQIALAVIFILVLGRYFLVPRSFGRLGHYRAAALETAQSHPIRYAGHLVCGECHEDVASVKQESRHAPVACEACHGPGAAHAEDPTTASVSVPSGRARCAYCHQYDPSRPTGFPQIHPDEHGEGEPCMTCHNPHAPRPDIAAESCEDCHAEIAHTKKASRHRSLTCYTCHGTQSEHPRDPHRIKPDVPRTRSFCGTCHSETADSPAYIPRVDLLSHGEDYVCWQCHYPHFPEAQR